MGETPRSPGVEYLVEPPLDLSATGSQRAEELEEGGLGHVDGLGLAAHALVADGANNFLAVGADGDGLTAHGVAVGLGAHEEVRKGDNVVRVVLASVIETAGTKTDIVVCQVARVAVAWGAAATAVGALGPLGRGLRSRLLGGLLRDGLGRGLRGRSGSGSGGGGRRRGGLVGGSCLRLGDRLRLGLLLLGLLLLGLRSLGLRNLRLGSRRRGGGGGLSNSRLLGLEKLGVLGVGRLRLLRLGTRGDPDGTGRIIVLSNVGGLRDPFGDQGALGMLVVDVTALVAVEMRLGQGRGGQGSAENGKSLHCGGGWCIVSCGAGMRVQRSKDL